MTIRMRSFRPLLLAVAMGLPLLVSAQKAFKQGESLMLKGFYHKAIPFLQEAVSEDSIALAATYLAQSYHKLGLYKDAEYWYRLLDDRGRMRAEDKLAYGQVLKSVGKYGQAKQAFETYTKWRPSDPVGPQMAFSCEMAVDLLNQPPIYRVENLNVLNTPQSDFAPSLYQGGLVFVSSRRGSTGSDSKNGLSPVTGEPYADLYYATRSGEKDFGAPIALPGKLNTGMDEGPVCFSADGQTMFFSRIVDPANNPEAASAGKGLLVKLFMASLENNEWKKVRQLGFTTDAFNYLHPSLSPDGRTLFFASDRPGGNGGFDLYRVVANEGNFGTPENLGNVLNTKGDELYPYYHPEGMLYFSSDLHPGMGGLDIFMSRWNQDRFEAPQNLRSGANSPTDDFGLLLDDARNTGYLSSNREGGMGADDIYFVFRIGPDDLPNLAEQPVDTVKPEVKDYVIISGKVVALLAEKHQNNWTKVKGDLLDNVVLQLTGATGKKAEVNSDAYGEFRFELQNPSNYTIVAKKQGYFLTRFDVAQPLGNGEFSLDLELEKIVLNEANPNGRMPNVQFAFNSDALSPDANTSLQVVANLLKENPEIHLELAGHACPIGPDGYNQQLSRRRAVAVANHLINTHSVPEVRLTVKAYGESQLAVPNPQTDEEYALNRRTEFIVRRLEGGNVYESAPIRENTKPKVIIEDVSLQGVPLPTGTHTDGTTNAPQYHTVEYDENLYRIALKYGTTVSELKRLNRLKSDRINYKQRLRVR